MSGTPESLPPVDDLAEMPAARRKRILEEGRAEAITRGRELLAGQFAAMSEAFEAAVEHAYRIGLETMADIAQPIVGSAEISAMEAREASARDAASLARLRALPAETVALAINGVIRHLLLLRAEWALKGAFAPGDFHLPRQEARAMAQTVEAALGLDLDQLDQTDLFDLRD